MVSAWWLAAFVCHGGLAYAAWHAPIERNHESRPIEVRVFAAPPKLPAETPMALKPAEPKPVIAAKPRVPRKPSPESPAPLAETTAAPDATPEVVGLTVASTTVDGAGPAFATGHTLSGATDAVAKPYLAPPLEPLAPTPAQRPSRNRVARAQPAQGVRVEPARRLSQIEPEYPALLQSQRTEGDVTVRVTLSAQGTVQHVELLRAASEAAFNDAALIAARRERFVPETHDGRPVSTSLTYTYRFRISP